MIRSMSLKLKFAANISWLFKDRVLQERYAAAKESGFQAVESADLTNIPLEELVSAKRSANLEHVLMNSFPGDTSQGECGISALPGREEEFRRSLNVSVNYCLALGCRRMHIMAGKRTGQFTDEEMLRVYIANLRYAAEWCSQHKITALIEPINTELSVPGYFLDSFDKALYVIETVGHPSLKLQLDIFHAQIINGNLTQLIAKCIPHLGHVQIAQVPSRHEPDSSGEINYNYIFSLLENHNYTGYIGLEYNPVGSTSAGLGWLAKYNSD